MPEVKAQWVTRSALSIAYLRLRTSLLIAIKLCILSSLSLSSATAGADPPGTFVDAAIISTDNTRICTAYVKNNKTEYYIGRVDGQKIVGKTYWSKNSIKLKLLDLSSTAKKLTASTDKKSKKLKLKSKADKLALTSAKQQLAKCTTAFKDQESSGLVQFAHVEKLIEKSCMTCHGVLGWTNTAEFFRDTGRVVGGDLEASPFYIYLNNNKEGLLPASMPKGLPALSDLNLWLLRRWVLDTSTNSAPPTPPGNNPSAGTALYQQFCSSCHGNIMQSTKSGRTAAQIAAAILNTPQMSHLQLSSLQIQQIASALGSSSEGYLTVTNVAAVSEGNPPGGASVLQFEVELHGTSSQPFSVGYVTTNGTALAGSDYIFKAGTAQFQGNDGEKQLINISILPDLNQESDETVYLEIGGISHNKIQTTVSSASGTILNDDTLLLNPPPQAGQARLAYSFDTNYNDSLGISNGQPQGDTVISSTVTRVGVGSLELDVGTDHIVVPGTNLSGLTNFSLAAWINWQNSATTSSRIFDFGSSTTNYIYFTPRDSGNRCRFEIRVAGTTFTLQCPSGQMMAANSWVYLTVTYNAALGEMKIYFNGTQVATRTGVTSILANLPFSNNLIGESRVAGNVDFAGNVDELTVWDAALTPSEIAQAMAMTSSSSFDSGMEVLLEGQVVPNGAVLDLGEVVTGKGKNISLVVKNLGPSGVSFTNTPNGILTGSDPSAFIFRIQPFAYQQTITPNNLTTFTIQFLPTAAGSYNSTVILPNSNPLLGNFALALTGEANGAPVPTPTPGGDPNLDQGIALYSNNCASCHGSIATSTKRGKSEEQITTALSPPPSGVVQMQGMGLSAPQINLIALALNSVLPTPSDTTDLAAAIANLGTAKHVASRYKNVFLPENPASYTSEDLTILSFITETLQGTRANGTFINGRAQYLGGGCERFDTNCHSELLKGNMKPQASVVRAGLIIKSCDLITDRNTAISNALAKIGRTLSSPIEGQAVAELYELFTPGRTLPNYISDPLVTSGSGAAGFNSTERWRFILNFLCTFQGWEGI